MLRNAVVMLLFCRYLSAKTHSCVVCFYLAFLHNAVKNIVNPSVKKNYLLDKLLVSNLVLRAKCNTPCGLC